MYRNDVAANTCEEPIRSVAREGQAANLELWRPGSMITTEN